WMELNGALVMAVNDSDMAYMPLVIEGCEETGIPYKQYTGDEARRLEPYLSEKTLAADWVPDGVFEPMRMCMAFLATAKKNGALVLPYTEGKGMHIYGYRVNGSRVW